MSAFYILRLPQDDPGPQDDYLSTEIYQDLGEALQKFLQATKIFDNAELHWSA